ncbi:hypothetical protein D6V68_22450 [Escherichia albertii]|nr:hypothetical protein [Escherichia albertii]EFO0112164.1 hypothetical protein [Escherichia albertii]MLY53892.1 hypothetical protein [Escherichia albertii]
MPCLSIPFNITFFSKMSPYLPEMAYFMLLMIFIQHGELMKKLKYLEFVCFTFYLFIIVMSDILI